MIAEQVLSLVQSRRQIVQDYTPLSSSIEWSLGQAYFRERGTQAFIGDNDVVPYVVNNDGNISRHATLLVYTQLLAAEVKPGA